MTYRRVQEYLILAALPGLMLCIVPVQGVEFRLSWHLAFLWLGASLFTMWLTSWWLRGLFLVALAATAKIPPAQTAYITLATIGIGLAVIERISGMDTSLPGGQGERRVIPWIRGAAALGMAWIIAQAAGLAFPGTEFIGPFNPDAAGIFLALCLPAFFGRKAWPGVIILLGAIAMTKTSTGFAAAAAACAVGAFVSQSSSSVKRSILAAIILMQVVFFWKIDPVANTAKCDRWIVWDHGTRAISRAPAGHGLGSWETIFPLLASGDRRIGEVLNAAGGRLTMKDVFRQAHNEYVQGAFEMGWAFIALIAAFLVFAAWAMTRGAVSPPVAGGVTALAVSCIGWHTFHIAPLALIGCAWLGLFLKTGKCTERGLK